MSTIHKKGSREECDNYKGIIGKILTKKIENEYSDFEAKEQAGFREDLQWTSSSVSPRR